jgi:transaldolase/glucose-6-phosphate isomerase
MNTVIQNLSRLGQSLWLDNIHRALLVNGELKAMIERGDLYGVTSNPTIFNNAISKTHDYDTALTSLAWSGWDAEKIFWELAIEDIKAACDLFMPLYEETNGSDGFVSLEVSPSIAHDTDVSAAQAQQLWARVARPNIMVKIPATKEGIPAIQRAIAAGVNINITLIFSLDRYAEVMNAYLSGLENRIAAGYPINHISSVASFFVSRVDTKIDDWLPKDSPLRGKAAIANAKLAYEKFRQTFTGERWEKLKVNGAKLQRPLWASTSTKNPAYPDTLYVDNLIGPDTVNTVPPQTLEAFRDHGIVEETLTRDLDQAHQTFAQLESAGISMAKATQELEDEGVEAFANSLEALFKIIEERRKKAAGSLGLLAESVAKRIAQLESAFIPTRIWKHDPSLWTSDPASQAEIKIRMGWMNLADTSRAALPEINALANEVHKSGIKNFLLLGMGGSSLAPEVFSRMFMNSEYRFSILDSTDPEQVRESVKNFPPSEALYIVSSKSGETPEVNALYDIFWELAKNDGSHFIAITDPGTPLALLAKERGFCKLFISTPNVGGRYSALTHFGLVPAALMGLDLNQLLDHSLEMQEQCAQKVPAARNPGLTLGAVIGESTLTGRDKLTILADEPFAAFGSWLEQLIAESSGKAGKGIIPIDMEPVGQPEVYGNDRLFVYLRQSGEYDKAVDKLRVASQPVLEFQIIDPYALTPEFYRWEFATAIACHILDINAFNQPDVQDSKDRTKAKIIAYHQTGKLEEPQPIFENQGVKLFSNLHLTGIGLADSLKAFLDAANVGDYIAINAYLPRNSKMEATLSDIRLIMRDRTKCATTVGFGPRFLHSTGQLHKGGTNHGLFLLVTTDSAEDVEIPTQEISFGVLERAQALGDYEALVSRGRRVLRIHIPSVAELNSLINALE